MRILLVNDYAMPLGGAETYMFSLGRLLEKHGHQVEIFGKKRMPGKAVVLTRLYNPYWSWRIAGRMKKFKPDIVHSHHVSYVLSPSVLRTAKRYGVPVVMSVHDFHLLCPVTWFVRLDGHPCTCGFGKDCFKAGCVLNPYGLYVSAKLLLHRKIIAGNVDCFITPSQILADWLKKSLGSDNVHVIRHFTEMMGIYTSPLKESKVILFVGRFVAEKGAACLIKAMPYILKEVPGARLVLVGDGEQRPFLQKLCRDLGIASDVIFAGWKDRGELGAYYEDAQLVCIPSIGMESCCLVLLESIACQRPVVASKIGAIPETVKKGTVGFLFEPGDHTDLAEKAVKLLKDFPLAREYAVNTSAVRYIYSEEYHYQQLAGIYTSCLEGS
jgi:glycosyltransferase involved in cell wall biosynthesis